MFAESSLRSTSTNDSKVADDSTKKADSSKEGGGLKKVDSKEARGEEDKGGGGGKISSKGGLETKRAHFAHDCDGDGVGGGCSTSATENTNTAQSSLLLSSSSLLPPSSSSLPSFEDTADRLFDHHYHARRRLRGADTRFDAAASSVLFCKSKSKSRIKSEKNSNVGGRMDDHLRQIPTSNANAKTCGTNSRRRRGTRQTRDPYAEFFDHAHDPGVVMGDGDDSVML